MNVSPPVSLIFTSASFLYFAFHLLDQNVCNASVSLHRQGKFKYAHFRDHLFHILDVPKLEEVVVPTRNHCLLKCVKSRLCFSANTAAFSRSDGNISCDPLPTDKYSAPEMFRANHSFHHYSVMTPCESLPCQHGGTCQPLYEKDEYTCICTGNFTGKHCDVLNDLASSSCKEQYEKHSSSKSQVYLLMIGSQKIPVYCHMKDFGCGGGGWTLAMKIDGAKETFHYDSAFWGDRNAYNLAGGQTGFDAQQTKLPTYWNTSFSNICLGMKIGQHINFLVTNKQAQSLYALIADGKYRATSLGRNKWKTLIGYQASLQPNCDMEGFNTVISGMHAKARIGILGNNQHDCKSTNSRIGFGTGGKSDDSNTCGNNAEKHFPDNGVINAQVMGYILVQ